MPDTLTLAPGIDVLAPDDGSELRYSEDSVFIVEQFISLLPFSQNEWAGKPFVLADWERDAIRQFYGVQTKDEDGRWVRYRHYFYDEIPKKNGKSELAAALGLYHLVGDGEAQPRVGIFAADKNNAGIIYDAAKFMVENSALSRPEKTPICWCRDSRKEIHTKYGGVLKVYSADADTKHGYSFSCVIFDELHAQPNRKLWDVLTFGSGSARRQPVWIVLTTAGDDPDRRSIGWEIHEKCRRLLALRAGKPESVTDEDDPLWCPIMYGLSVLTGDDEDKIAEIDIYDEKLWALCNPSLGKTVKLRTLRQEAKAAKQSEAQERLFRWLRLNQWVATKSVGWLPLTLYDRTQINPRPDLRGKRCFGGLDLSSSTDLTAFVLVFPPQEGLETWVTISRAWLPNADIERREKHDHAPYRDWARAGFLTLCEGDMIDYPSVIAEILEAKATYDLRLLGVDPYLSRTITAQLQESGVNVVEIPQTMAHMSPAMKQLEEMLRGKSPDGKMLHEHNTCARFCFGNVRCATDGNGNLKPMKNRSRGRIDITVAWIIAVAASRLDPGKDINEIIKERGYAL